MSSDIEHLLVILLFITGGFVVVLCYIRSVRNRLNGRLTELVEAVRKQARSEGVAEGTATERARYDHRRD
jgi:predicted Holliday junction resolvase-like endonuclease